MAKPTELAPISATFQTGVPSVDNEIAELRARIAELEAALAEWQKKAAAAAVVLHEKIHECNDLKADCARLREDAERWRMVPAFLEKYQLDYVGLLADIDAARREKP